MSFKIGEIVKIQLNRYPNYNPDNKIEVKIVYAQIIRIRRNKFYTVKCFQEINGLYSQVYDEIMKSDMIKVPKKEQFLVAL